MNKYAAGGLINEALMRGKQVIVISFDGKASARAFEAVVKEVDRMQLQELFGVKTLRAKGQERVLCGVGTIRFLSPRMSLRGFEADIVFIDNEADRVAFDDNFDKVREFLADVRALTATGGEVIRS